MATLEKIRSKSVFLFCIIIVALLAFILGDFLTSGRSFAGPGTTMVKGGGQKVDIQEYQARQRALSDQMKNQDPDEAQQILLNNMLMEKLMDAEYDKLGITVSDAEINAAMGVTSDYAMPAAQQLIQGIAPQFGLLPTGQNVLSLINNPGAYQLDNQTAAYIKQMWAQTEQQVEEQLKSMKFENLLSGLYVANELDAKSLYADANNTYQVKYVTRDFTAVPDADVEATDADYKAAYDKVKERYALDGKTRLVDYIAVEIVPSTEDLLAGQKEVEDALVGLATMPGTQAIDGNSKFVKQNGPITINALKNNNQMDRVLRNKLVNALDTLSANEVVLVQHVGNKYDLLKVIDVTNGIDSINITLINTIDQAANDSVYKSLKAGASFEEFASIDGFSRGNDSIWINLYSEPLGAVISEALATAPMGEYIAYTDTTNYTGQLNYVIKVNKRNKPVKVYDIAMMSYETEPSATTRTDLFNALNQFVNANKSTAAFVENASEAGYEVVRDVPVDGASAHIGNVPSSRPAVKWAMDAKKGAVSPVFKDNKNQSYYLAVAIDDIYTGDYVPYNSPMVKSALQPQVMADKKAASVIDQYAGKADNVDGYAQLMEGQAQTASVSFGTPRNPVLSSPAVIGAIGAAEKGKVVGPLQGNTQVVVFELENVDESGRPYDFNAMAAQYNRNAVQAIGRNLYEALLGNNKVTNNSLHFESSAY